MILGASRLRFESVTSFIERRPGLVTALLCVAWMLPGLLGRDPWKPDEAYVFGVVHHMVLSGDWLVPAIAGEPFLSAPPLYYASAALVGQALAALLPLHDGARLVNVLYGAATFWFTAGAARELDRDGRSWVAPLLLLGCVGLVQPAHLLVPDNALLTAFAMAMYASGLARRRAVAAGVLLGAAVGLAFLSKGAVSAAMLALAVVLVPFLVQDARRTLALKALPVALAVATALVAVWPWALHAREPSLVAQWWASDLARLTGGTRVPTARASPLYYVAAIPWFAWPVLPFAAWTLWKERTGLRSAEIGIPLAFAVATALVLSASFDARELYALPLLVPLALLAQRGIATVPRGTNYAFFWFSIAFFLFFVCVVWFYWVAVDFGVPERLARHMDRMEPGYVPAASLWRAAPAAVLTLAWFVGLFNIRRSPERPFLAWSAGAVAFWGVLMTLMVGWIDNAKSYREMIASLQASLPARYDCIAGLALGESQRALMLYHGGIVVRQVKVGEDPAVCDLLLSEGTVDRGLLPSPWEMVWEGHRAGDTRERYRLYRFAAARGDSGKDR
jgi:4-amino-4-deoxy-L-arabinose transferase-like glycosyltransferase